MNNVLTIVYQNKKAELFKGIVDLSKLNYKSNLGVVIASMLQALGYAWSKTGKKLWRRAEPDGALPYYIPPSRFPPPLSASLSGSPQPKPLPSALCAGEKLDWRAPAGRASRRPPKTKPRPSGASLAHEADAACSARGKAAERASPPVEHMLGRRYS